MHALHIQAFSNHTSPLTYIYVYLHPDIKHTTKIPTMISQKNLVLLAILLVVVVAMNCLPHVGAVRPTPQILKDDVPETLQAKAREAMIAFMARLSSGPSPGDNH